VARADRGTETERPERGVVLPRARAVRATLLCLEEAAERGRNQSLRGREVASAGESAPGRAIEIRLAGGRSVMVEPGLDAAHLRAVVAALEART
jgi:hypothetical protein